MRASRARSIAGCSPAMQHAPCPTDFRTECGARRSMRRAMANAARSGSRSPAASLRWCARPCRFPTAMRTSARSSSNRPASSWSQVREIALTRLLNLTLVATLFVIVVTIVFAARLSLRIRRLSRAASTALTAEGRIEPHIPGHEGARRAGCAGAQLRHAARPPAGVHELSADARHEAVARAAHAVDDRQLVAGQPELGGEAAAAGAELHRASAQRREPHARDSHRAQRSDARRADHRAHRARALRLARAGAEHGAGLSSRRSSQHRIETQVPEEPCLVEGSPDLIAQLLDKLMDNASDFTPKGGPIAIVLAARPALVHVDRAQRGTAPAAAAGQQPSVRIARHQPQQRQRQAASRARPVHRAADRRFPSRHRHCDEPAGRHRRSCRASNSRSAAVEGNTRRRRSLQRREYFTTAAPSHPRHTAA